MHSFFESKLASLTNSQVTATVTCTVMTTFAYTKSLCLTFTFEMVSWFTFTACTLGRHDANEMASADCGLLLAWVDAGTCVRRVYMYLCSYARVCVYIC
jgi:hypothetical protein